MMLHHTLHRLLRAPLLGALAVLVIAGTLAGCDFASVDEGTDVPIGDLLTSVRSAQTQADAELALRQLLNKTGVGVPQRPGQSAGSFALYTLSDRSFKQLASAQAAYNRGELGNPLTVEDAYETMMALNGKAQQVTDETVFETPLRSFSAPMDAVLASIAWAAEQASAEPERADNSLVLAIATQRETEAAARKTTGASPISPIQHYLLSIWIHKYGPSMPLFTDTEETAAGPAAGPAFGSLAQGGVPGILGGGNQDCPNGTFLIAKYEVEDGIWLDADDNVIDPDITLSNFVVKDQDDPGEYESFDFTSDVTIQSIVVKGGTRSSVEPLGGVKTGTVTNSVLGRRPPALSNVKFCGSFQSCADIVAAKVASCAAVPGNTVDGCTVTFKAELDGCHDQGLIGTL